jgi:hypothetical protein
LLVAQQEMRVQPETQAQVEEVDQEGLVGPVSRQALRDQVEPEEPVVVLVPQVVQLDLALFVLFRYLSNPMSMSH